MIIECNAQTIVREKIKYDQAKEYLEGSLSEEAKMDFYNKVREEGAVSWLLRIGRALAGSNKNPEEMKTLVAELKQNIF